MISSIIAKGGAQKLTSRQQSSADLKLADAPAVIEVVSASSVKRASIKKPFLVNDDILTSQLAVLKNPAQCGSLAVLEKFGCDKLAFMLQLNKDICAAEPKTAMRPKGIWTICHKFIFSNTSHFFFKTSKDSTLLHA
jgi:hypothetical protein